jgi:hypothetical protein
MSNNIIYQHYIRNLNKTIICCPHDDHSLYENGSGVSFQLFNGTLKGYKKFKKEVENEHISKHFDRLCEENKSFIYISYQTLREIAVSLRLDDIKDGDIFYREVDEWTGIRITIRLNNGMIKIDAFRKIDGYEWDDSSITLSKPEFNKCLTEIFKNNHFQVYKSMF